jgi:hypothetical protein
MDANHNTNWLSWQLYTIMVRDPYGSWLPVGHFLTAKGDGDVVGEALATVEQWVPTHLGSNSSWPARWFLTDDSAVEQKAVRRAFTPLGSTLCSVGYLLCSLQSERTLRRRLAGKRLHSCLNHPLSALKGRFTEPGCLQSINAAIVAAEAIKDLETAKYIRENWLPTRHMWANYAREHSPLLLQVTSTNALEGYHSALKYGNESVMQQFSLLGIVKHVLDLNKRYFQQAATNKNNFCGKSIREAVLVKGLMLFPVPV